MTTSEFLKCKIAERNKDTMEQYERTIRIRKFLVALVLDTKEEPGGSRGARLFDAGGRLIAKVTDPASSVMQQLEERDSKS